MRGHAFLTGAYVERRSLVHRTPLWLKFCALLAVSIAALGASNPLVATVLLFLVVGVHVAGRLPGARLWLTVRMLLPVLVLLGAFQWWQNGPGPAWRVVAGILAVVLASSVLTATTRPAAILAGLASLVQPLARFGADPDRFALTVGLMLRSIPFLIGSFDDVRDAARARGLERNLRARTWPVLMGTVAYARQTGEALTARGLGDPSDDGDA